MFKKEVHDKFVVDAKTQESWGVDYDSSDKKASKLYCSAKVIADSYCPNTNARITTLELVYPRFIHSELLTHRMFSRNASSSRATPVDTIIKQVTENPAFFSSVGCNQSGMQPGELVPEGILVKFRMEWDELANIVAGYCHRWNHTYNIHKQYANRPMEAFMLMRVLVTATDWSNFFGLRLHPNAQEDIQFLAQTMYTAMAKSDPKIITHCEFHLPYVTEAELNNSDLRFKDLLAMSTARCARVSYLTFDQKVPTLEQDKKLFKRLITADPMHASPLEHIAQSTYDTKYFANLYGWSSLRNAIETGEVSKEYLLDV